MQASDWSVFGGRNDQGISRSPFPRLLRRPFFLRSLPNLGFSPITAQSRTVVAHHERGELDGAQEVDRG